MQFDPFFYPGWNEWKHVDAVRIDQAACLLTLNDPAKWTSSRDWPREAEPMAIAIEQAILARKLEPLAVWKHSDFGDLVPVPNHRLSVNDSLSRSSTVLVEHLAAWCDKKNIPHCWPTQSATEGPAKTMDIDRFPPELRAAIEAHDAVRANAVALAGRTPRTALVEWLKTHKPGIGSNARERIATVANWKPEGGAPKTPGG